MVVSDGGGVVFEFISSSGFTEFGVVGVELELEFGEFSGFTVVESNGVGLVGIGAVESFGVEGFYDLVYEVISGPDVSGGGVEGGVYGVFVG